MELGCAAKWGIRYLVIDSRPYGYGLSSVHYWFVTTHNIHRIYSRLREWNLACSVFTKLVRCTFISHGNHTALLALSAVFNERYDQSWKSKSTLLSPVSSLLRDKLATFSAALLSLTQLIFEKVRAIQSVISGTNTVAYLLQTAIEAALLTLFSFANRRYSKITTQLNVIAFAKGSLYLGQKRLCLV